jgi:hypothetical protein
VSEFGGNDVFTIDASILFYKLCECKVNSDKKFNVAQHLKTEKQLHTNDVIIQGKTGIPGAELGEFRGSADPQLVFIDKIGLLEIFFSF